MSDTNLQSFTKKILIDKCKELGITGYSNKNKNEIIQLINNHNQNDIDEIEEKLSSISINTHLSPLIKWSGGKTDEINNILPYIPTNYETYIEPFIGGGALFWYLCPNKAVINDIHPELIKFYNVIKNGQSQNIYDFMNENKNDEETYYNVRDYLNPNNDLEIASQFYYLRKTCFRGMLRYNSNGKFNIPFGKYKSINYSDLLNNNYYDILQNTEIYNLSYNDIFDKYNDPNNFVFLDPPYDSKFTDYGYCSFDRNEQIKLAERFKNTRNKCLMIIGKTDFITELYKDYIKGEYEKRYKFKIHSGRVGNEINTTHLVIANY